MKFYKDNKTFEVMEEI